MKKRKERAVRYFGIFMLFMLICTIVSRGIYAWQMPKVSLGTIKANALKRRIEATGTVMTKEEVPVVTGPGFLVKRVCVVEGERVEPGDVLFEADLTDLDELLKQTESQIRAEEAKLAELNNAGSSAVNRANQDLKDASEASAGDVVRANEAYQAAVALRDNASSEDAYKKKAYEQDAEYQRLSKAAEKKNATKKEKEEFRAYKKSLDARLSESYAQEKQALNDAVSEKEQALSDANKSRMDSVKQAQRALEDAKSGGGGSKIEQENVIRQLKENREGMLTLKQSEGKVVCNMAGYVSRILVRAGERTADTSAMVLSDANGEKLFQAILPQEEKSYVTPGDKMDITFPGGAKQMMGVAIDAVGMLEDGSCQVTGKISNSNANIGETGSMELVKEIGHYSCTIPIAALHTKDNTNYVLLAEEQETILGTELTAKMRKVKVIDQDEEYAALEDGTLTDEEKLIVDSDKDVKDGTRVREWEE